MWKTWPKYALGCVKSHFEENAAKFYFNTDLPDGSSDQAGTQRL